MYFPAWLRSEIETIGKQLLNGDVERGEAAELLSDTISERDAKLVQDIIREFSRKRLTRWVNQQQGRGRKAALVELNTGHRQEELFDWLPRTLETSPGRFAHLTSMTGREWDMALRQAEVKAGNSSRYYQDIKRAYDAVRPLLTSDGMTTADVVQDIR
jgi:hypothetical protein